MIAESRRIDPAAFFLLENGLDLILPLASERQSGAACRMSCCCSAALRPLSENCAAPGLAAIGHGRYLAAEPAFSRGSSGLCLFNSSKTGTISAPEASY